MSRQSRVRATAVAGLTGLLAAAAATVALNTAHAATVRYEAEDAPATCDGEIESEHAGFSGSGFCNTDNTTGAAAQFTVDAPDAGAATVVIRYASGGSGDRPAGVTVNGSTVASATFAATGAWTNWATETIPVQLNAGSNTIRFTATGSSGLPNLDYLEAEVGDGEPTQSRYEAEDSPATCDGAIESEHAGFSGTGFCNTDNTTGAAAQFTVTAAEAGTATLTVGFANGDSSGRPAGVAVNG